MVGEQQKKQGATAAAAVSNNATTTTANNRTSQPIRKEGIVDNNNDNNDDDDDEGSHFPIYTNDPHERIQRVVAGYKKHATTPFAGPFEANLLTDENFKLVSADISSSTSPLAALSSSSGAAAAYTVNESRTVMEFVATPALCSRRSNLQGGATALVVDMCTGLTLAPIVRRDFWYYGGMTRNLNVTYLRPVPLGTVVSVESEIMQIGRRVALIACKLRAKDTGKLLVTADHHLVVVDGDPSPDRFTKKKAHLS